MGQTNFAGTFKGCAGTLNGCAGTLGLAQAFCAEKKWSK